MLLLHRLFLRFALLYLLAGTALGVVLEVSRGLGSGSWPYAAVTLHVHLLGVGFLFNIVMGVAHWMFPRLPRTTAAEAARDPLGWANLVALNSGLLLRVAAELGGPGLGRAHVFAAGLQGAGVVLFVVAIWRRVRFPKWTSERSA
jgi:hypothetical protein